MGQFHHPNNYCQATWSGHCGRTSEYLMAYIVGFCSNLELINLFLNIQGDDCTGANEQWRSEAILAWT